MRRRLAIIAVALFCGGYFATWVWGRPAAARVAELRAQGGSATTAEAAVLQALDQTRQRALVDTIHPRMRTLPIAPGLILVTAEYPAPTGARKTTLDMVVWFGSGARHLASLNSRDT